MSKPRDLPLEESTIHICPQTQTFAIVSTYQIGERDFLIASAKHSDNGLVFTPMSHVEADEQAKVGPLQSREEQRYNRVQAKFDTMVAESPCGQIMKSNVAYIRGGTNERVVTATTHLKNQHKPDVNYPTVITTKLENGDLKSHSIKFHKTSTARSVASVDITLVDAETKKVTFTLKDSSQIEFSRLRDGHAGKEKFGDIVKLPEVGDTELPTKMDRGGENARKAKELYESVMGRLDKLAELNAGLASSIKKQAPSKTKE